MIRVYRAPWSTNCERIALALAHKGIEAESVMIDYSDRSGVERVSGQGLVPVIDDDGDVVADSVAIIRHLEERRPESPLWPADDPDRARIDVFIEWFNEVWKLAPNQIEGELEKAAPDQGLVGELSRQIDADQDIFEGMLADGEYLLGEFSAADIVAYPHLKYGAGCEPGDDELFHVILDDHLSLEGRPRLAAWVERMAERPRAFPQT